MTEEEVSKSDRRGGGRNSRQTDLPSHLRSVSKSWAQPLLGYWWTDKDRTGRSLWPGL